MSCGQGVAQSTPLIANGTTAITPASRYWGYEYTGNEVANYRAGKKQLDLYDGTFFLSSGELAIPTDVPTRTLYQQINRLTSYDTSVRSKMYYFMSQRDLCFSCSKGLQNPSLCPGYAGSSSSSSSAISCTTNAQCPSGQACVNGTCGTCSSNAQCNGQVCSNGTCVPCDSTHACSSGQVCSNGLCINSSSSTSSACSGALCPNNQLCLNGTCTACDSTHTCPNGLICTNGTCGQCTNSTQCPSGQACVNGTCGQCTFTAQCPVGQACVNGTCGSCTTSGQCSGQVCSNGTCVPCDSIHTCPNGLICTSGTCGVCTNSSQCPSGQVCSSGACVPVSSSSSSSSSSIASSVSSASCVNGTLCENNQVCSNGTCQPCGGTVTCPSPLICSSGTCVPESSSSSSSLSSSSVSSSSSAQCDNVTNPCPSGQTCVGNQCIPLSSSSSSNGCTNVPASCHAEDIPNCTSALFNSTTCSCECKAFASSSSSSKPFIANTCGNGVLETYYNTFHSNVPDEECDDGNNNDDDGCYSDCTTMIPPALLGQKAASICPTRSSQWTAQSVWFDRIDSKLPSDTTINGSIPSVNGMGMAGQALTFASPSIDDGGVEKIWLFGSSSGTNVYLNSSYQYATAIYSSADGIHWNLRGELPVGTRNDISWEAGISIVKYQNPASQGATELWLFGGKSYDRSKPLGNSDSTSNYTNKTYVSQDGMNWVQGPPLPYKVFNPHAAVLNGKIYVVAEGIVSKLPWYQTNPRSGPSRMVFSFNGTSWQVEPELIPFVAPTSGIGLSIPPLRLVPDAFTSPTKSNRDYSMMDYSFVPYNGKLYLIGGQSSGALSSAGYSYDVFSFNGSHWTRVGVLPTRMADASAVVYQNRLWLLGGGYLLQNVNSYSSCDVFSTTNGKDWRQEVNFMPTPRVNATALTYRLGASDALWVMGGSVSGRKVQVMQTNYTSTATGSVKTSPYCVGSYDYAEPRCDTGNVTCPAGYSPSCYTRPGNLRYWGVGVSSAPTGSDGQFHNLGVATNICSLNSPASAMTDSSQQCTPASDVIGIFGNYEIDSDDYYSHTTNPPSSKPSIPSMNYAYCNNCPDFSKSAAPVCVKNDDPSVTTSMICSGTAASSSSSTSVSTGPTLSGSLLWAELGKINTIGLNGIGKKPFYVPATYKNPSTGVTFYYSFNAIVVDHANRKAYWSMQNPDFVNGTTSGDYQIVAADMNSSGIASNPTVLLQSSSTVYTGLALDGNGNLYFAQMPATGFSSTSRIRKMNLATKQVTEIATIDTTVAVPSGLAIDAQHSLLLWTKFKEMYAADLAGQGAHKIITRPTNIQNLLTVDPVNQRIYWYDIPSGSNTGTIRSMNYDGSGVSDLLSCIQGSSSVVFYPEFGSLIWLSPYNGTTSTPGNIYIANQNGVTSSVPIVTTGTTTVLATTLALDISAPSTSLSPTISSPLCVSAP